MDSVPTHTYYTRTFCLYFRWNLLPTHTSTLSIMRCIAILVLFVPVCTFFVCVCACTKHSSLLNIAFFYIRSFFRAIGKERTKRRSRKNPVNIANETNEYKSVIAYLCVAMGLKCIVVYCRATVSHCRLCSHKKRLGGEENTHTRRDTINAKQQTSNNQCL